jgi:hypothetical protein
MASSKRQARVISLTKLSASVDQAVSLAAKRYEISAKSPNLLGRGQIMGRLIEGTDVATAFAMAETVTAQINKLPGIDAVPAISRVGRGILMGFVDRSQILHQFGDG